MSAIMNVGNIIGELHLLLRGRYPEVLEEYFVSYNKPAVLENLFYIYSEQQKNPFYDEKKSKLVLEFVAINEYTPPKILRKLGDSSSSYIQTNLALNPRTPQATIRKILRSEIAKHYFTLPRLVEYVLRNPNLDEATAKLIMQSPVSFDEALIADKEKIGDDLMRELLTKEATRYRVIPAIIQKKSSSPEILSYIYSVFMEWDEESLDWMVTLSGHENMPSVYVESYLKSLPPATEKTEVYVERMIKNLQKVHGLFPDYPTEWVMELYRT